jgi:hypothetical protein
MALYNINTNISNNFNSVDGTFCYKRRPEDGNTSVTNSSNSYNHVYATGILSATTSWCGQWTRSSSPSYWTIGCSKDKILIRAFAIPDTLGSAGIYDKCQFSFSNCTAEIISQNTAGASMPPYVIAKLSDISGSFYCQVQSNVLCAMIIQAQSLV